MAFTVGGLAKFYSYFKTGASLSDMMTEVQKTRVIHDPVYHWDMLRKNKGVELDEFTRNDIEDAYSSAWYILNKSNTAHRNLGLEDKFSKKMVDKIIKAYNSKPIQIVERVELEHNIKLDLFSYDRQLISFTDTKVMIVQKLNGNLIYDHLDFEIVMGLEDGYWKVFEMVQVEGASTDEKIVSNKQVDKIQIQEKIKGINYYPSDHPWLDFWPSYQQDTVIKDLELAKKIGFNHLRIFLPYSVFGKGNLDQSMLKNLDHFLDVCKDKNLTTTITLFDFPESYHLAHFPATRKHLIQLLTRYKDHPAITIWDLKNEADLDFQHYNKKTVLDWLELMIATANEHAPHINLTVGWSDIQYAGLLADKLEVISFHIYKDLNLESKNFQALKSKVPNKPYYVSEFGKTSYQAKLLPFGSTIKEQAVYTKEVLDFLDQENIPHFAYWTLHDFDQAPKEVIGWKPWIRKAQENMGLVTRAGNYKSTIDNFLLEDGYPHKLKWHQKIKPFYPIFCLITIFCFLIFRSIVRSTRRSISN